MDRARVERMRMRYLTASDETIIDILADRLAAILCPKSSPLMARGATLTFDATGHFCPQTGDSLPTPSVTPAGAAPNGSPLVITGQGEYERREYGDRRDRDRCLWSILGRLAGETARRVCRLMEAIRDRRKRRLGCPGPRRRPVFLPPFGTSRTMR